MPIKTLLENCGMNRNTIFDLEKKGSFPSCDKLAKIADQLNCSTDYLLGRGTTDNRIKTARERTKALVLSNVVSIPDIESKLDVNYHTLRAWCDGIGDYFNDKLYVVAEIFSVSVDFLLGLTDYTNTNVQQPEAYTFPIAARSGNGDTATTTTSEEERRAALEAELPGFFDDKKTPPKSE